MGSMLRVREQETGDTKNAESGISMHEVRFNVVAKGLEQDHSNSSIP